MDGTGHVKLTDFGLATGALNPVKIESLRKKVRLYNYLPIRATIYAYQLDKFKDTQIVHRSTLERRSIYRSIRQTDPRYADSIVGSPDYMVFPITCTGLKNPP